MTADATADGRRRQAEEDGGTTAARQQTRGDDNAEEDDKMTAGAFKEGHIHFILRGEVC